ncbi:hypothetical protein D3C76_1143060 [compost metagenome]
MHFQRAVTGIRRQNQLFPLLGVKATLLVARGDAFGFRNDPDLVQTQTVGFAWVVFGVTHPGTRTHNLELTRRNLLFVTHAVLVLNGAVQNVGQDFHVFVRVGTKALAGIDNVIVNHSQCRETHKVRVIIIGKREAVP